MKYCHLIPHDASLGELCFFPCKLPFNFDLTAAHTVSPQGLQRTVLARYMSKHGIHHYPERARRYEVLDEFGKNYNRWRLDGAWW